MNKIHIVSGTTSARIHLDPNRTLWDFISKIAFEHLIVRQWNKRLHKFEIDRAYGLFDTNRGIFHIPINFLPVFEEAIRSTNFPYEHIVQAPVEQGKITIQLKKDWIAREDQVPAIEYLSNEATPRRGLAAQPGFGKTSIATAAAVKMGYPTLVIASGLYQQWAQSIYNQTTAVKKDIWILAGAKSIHDAWIADVTPSFIIASLETLREYVYRSTPYRDIPPYREFLKKFKIGTKIMDEVHLHFYAGTRIDLASNIANNIYLTATFGQSDRAHRKVFNTIFPYSMRFGEEDYDAYVTSTQYLYNGWVPEGVTRSNRGYNHNRFENYLLKRKTYLKRYFDEVVDTVFSTEYIHYKTKGDKCMIYFARIEMIEYAVAYLQQHYPELKISPFYKTQELSAVSHNDVLVTNLKKGGVGKDLKDLCSVICTVSFRTDIGLKQLVGRLRRRADGKPVRYSDITDTCSSAQYSMYEARKSELKTLATSNNEVTLF